MKSSEKSYVLRYAAIVVALALLASCARAASDVSTSCAAIARTLMHPGSINGDSTPRQFFALTGIVQHVMIEPSSNACEVAVSDDSGACLLVLPARLRTPHVVPGEKFRFAGYVSHHIGTTACITNALPCGECVRPMPPIPFTNEKFISGGLDWRLTGITGYVLDVVRSELASDWKFLLLQCESRILYVALPDLPNETSLPTHLIGATVNVEAVCLPYDGSYRYRIGRTFHCAGLSHVRVFRPSPSNAFDRPDIESVGIASPQELSNCGRLLTRGRVIANGINGRTYLRTQHRDIVKIEWLDDAAPRPGEWIEAVGLPETDLQHINLTRAIWRRIAPKDMPEEETVDLLKGLSDVRRKSSATKSVRLYGKIVTCTGKVLAVPSTEREYLYLQAGTLLVRAFLPNLRSRLPRLAVGCKVRVTGCFVLDIGEWRPTRVFPQVEGFAVIARNPDDVVILANPPWWTPLRIGLCVSFLVALLIGILIWNRSLRILVERRGRELIRGQIKNLRSELKTEERTHLAVELHDSVSQCLTGVAMEIRVSEKLINTDSQNAMRHLRLALRTLGSAHAELRNCLWDLRNQALELPSCDEAIRHTLSPCIASARLSVAFHVPRKLLTDKTMHDILSILRELSVNAIRHGKANEIAISGFLSPGVLKFSCRDNGCGFDTNDIPDITTGHFGLQGIRERVEMHSGSMEVVSDTTRGTCVEITFSLPKKETGNECEGN